MGLKALSRVTAAPPTLTAAGMITNQAHMPPASLSALLAGRVRYAS